LIKQNLGGTVREKTIQNKPAICEALQSMQVHEELSLEEALNSVSTIVSNNTKKITDRRIPKLWFDDETKNEFEKYRKALKTLNHAPNPQNAKLFMMAKRKWHVMVKNKKFAAFHEKISKISPRTTTRELWKIVNSVDGRKNNAPRCNFILESEIQSHLFMEKYFTSVANFSSDDKNYAPVQRSQDRAGNYHLNNEDPTVCSPSDCFILTEEIFDEILSSKRENSAPGNDGITFYFLKQLPPKMKKKIICEMNKIFTSREIPNFLKNSQVLALLKPGKDKCQVESHRPIILQRTVLKLLSSFTLRFAEEFALQNKIIPHTSFGFQKGKSTTMCTNYINTWINAKKAEGKNVLMVALDMSSAFDNVRIDKLLEIMTELKFPKIFLDLIKSSYSNRKVTLTNNEGKQFTKIVDVGLPQGDPACPFWFNIYSIPLQKINSANCEVVLFADDGTILFAADKNRNLQQLANGKLRSYSKILKELNFKVNPSKTAVLLFNHKNDAYTPKIELDGVELKIQNHTKILGTTFDSRLKFKEHHDEMIRRVEERSNVIKRLSGTKYGSHPSSMMMVFRASVRSVVEYDAPVYGNWLKKYDNSLQKKYNQILRLILGVPRTTPENIVSALACEPPISIRRQSLILKHTITECTNETPTHKIWSKIREEKSGKFKNDTTRCYMQNKSLVEQVEKTKINKFKSCQLNIRTDIHKDVENKDKFSPLVLKKISLSYINPISQTHPVIYTDASKIDAQCGFGLFCPTTSYELKFKLCNYSSIFAAEMTAIKHALIYAHTQKLENPVIFTDSLSSCIAIEKRSKSTHISETIFDVIELLTRTGGTIMWVPAHVGIEGNERADQLAKEAILEDEEQLSNKIFKTDVKAMLKKELFNDWQKFYSESEKGQKFKNIMPCLKDKPWFEEADIDANDVKIINRLISNHSFDKRWLHRFGKVDTEMCDDCLEVETAEHLVFRCRKYDRRTFPALFPLKSTEDFWKIPNKKSCLNEMKKFLKENKIVF
jgi:ribonuclease HI